MKRKSRKKIEENVQENTSKIRTLLSPFSYQKPQTLPDSPIEGRLIPSEIIGKRKEYSMNDLLDIESSEIDQDNDLSFTEPLDTQEVLYDERNYDDNNAWESFMEVEPNVCEPLDLNLEPNTSIENTNTGALSANQPVSPPNPSLKDQNFSNSEALADKKTLVNVESLPDCKTRKNEIRNLLMDLF